MVDEQETDQQESAPQQTLTPMQWPPDGYTPGKYAPWFCNEQDGQEKVYGPDELGEYKSAVDELIENVNKCDAAARIWEVLQAWEQRLFRRNYHFLNAGWKGWGMFGGSSGTSGASIMQTQNSMKLFSCNVFGTRHKKIVSLLGRSVPAVDVTPVEDDDPIDQAAAEASEDYLKVFNNEADLARAVKKMAGYFYTDGRTIALTYTVADQTRWGTEVPNRQQETYGAPESEGISPETENDPLVMSEDPARKEVCFIGGKLESKVPLMADEEDEMGWVRYQHELGVNLLREKYPWVEEKIATQGNVGGMDQIDRMARINVRLAVQASSSSGESYKNDATETVTFFRPSEYRAIKKEMREAFYEAFPDGMEVWHAGGQLAMVRNCRMSKHVKIVHPYPGDGQNRESIGTNYLPLQKVLNANISLLDRYFRNAIARRFAMEPYIDTQVLNTTSNDPAKVTAVHESLANKGLKISDITGIEQVPQPNTAMFEFIEWLIQGAPEAMDGGTAAAFGENDGESDQGVFKTTRLKRDQALQVFAMPWNALCEAVECISLQAIESAAANRKNDISASLPGQQKLKIEIEKLQGSVLVQRSSGEIPQTLAEEEEQMSALIEQSANVELYKQIVNDPSNLAVFARFPSLRDLNVSGADSAEQQQGEFEILMKSGPLDNPKLQIIAEQIQKAELDPEAQTPEGQQMLQQLTQMAQTLPPQVSSVPVAQDNSENHVIHAAITLGMLTSATGRKLKNGDEEQQAIWQNLKLHWQEHMTMAKSLAPPKEMEFKGSVTIDPSKFPPDAQEKMFEAMGLDVPPFALQTQDQTHEITSTKKGVDENGAETEQKVSVVGKPLN